MAKFTPVFERLMQIFYTFKMFKCDYLFLKNSSPARLKVLINDNKSPAENSEK